jgi:bacterioferritin-associated ferredoxin
MIVCLCRGTSDRDIRAAIDDGLTCVRDLSRAGIAGGDCRGCERTLEKLIAASEPPPSSCVCASAPLALASA